MRKDVETFRALLAQAHKRRDLAFLQLASMAQRGDTYARSRIDHEVNAAQLEGIDA